MTTTSGRLATPETIRSLQKKLYVKAKKEPEFRFYSLYDKVHRRDILEHAYRKAKANRGASGVDKETFESIEAKGLEKWLGTLQEELRTKRYRAQPVRREYIPKPGGGQRPLGIPTIRDRVVQTAAVLVMSPIFEADFNPQMYAYRPGRSAHDAIGEVHKALKQGYTDVVDADLTRYFDRIPHSELLKSVARRVSDGAMLRLIRMWLKVPVEEQDQAGRGRRTGGKANTRGTPQGGVASPMLANIYMNRYLKGWRKWKMGERLRAKVVNYADDFVVLCRGTARQALDWTRKVMTEIGLQLNEEKTKLRDARREGFDFLGYTFGPAVHRPTGRTYLAVQPSRKAVKRYRERIRGILRPGNQAPWPEVAAQLNRMTKGWTNYFRYGHVTRAYWWLNAFLLHRVRGFLRRRHKAPGRGVRRFPADDVFGAKYGVQSFAGLKGAAASHA
jgi:RNA-directed DNA polymerase